MDRKLVDDDYGETALQLDCRAVARCKRYVPRTQALRDSKALLDRMAFAGTRIKNLTAHSSRHLSVATGVDPTQQSAIRFPSLGSPKERRAGGFIAADCLSRRFHHHSRVALAT
jgi:hypothetical protein